MDARSIKTKITDPAVRAKLIEQLSIVHENSRILEEFSVAKGRARADVVAVNNHKIHAYEIKSDADNLQRLPGQQKYYSALFNTVTLVVGMEHVVKAMYMIPDWWGVTVVFESSNGIELKVIREPKDNENMNSISISEVMRKEEMVALLTRHAPGRSYSRLNKPMLVREAEVEINTKLIAKEFPRIIFARTCTQLA